MISATRAALSTASTEVCPSVSNTPGTNRWCRTSRSVTTPTSIPSRFTTGRCRTLARCIRPTASRHESDGPMVTTCRLISSFTFIAASRSVSPLTWPLCQQRCTRAIEPGVLVSPHGVIQSLVEELAHHDLELLLAVQIRRCLREIILPDEAPEVLFRQDERIHQLTQ